MRHEKPQMSLLYYSDPIETWQLLRDKCSFFYVKTPNNKEAYQTVLMHMLVRAIIIWIYA